MLRINIILFWFEHSNDGHPHLQYILYITTESLKNYARCQQRDLI